MRAILTCLSPMPPVVWQPLSKIFINGIVLSRGTALLSKKSIDSLFTTHGSSRENQISYGYGFFIGPQNQELEGARETLVGHSGTIEGFRAASSDIPMRT